MSSPIRALLAAAQQAENSGDVSGAVRHLEEAAVFYRDRGMATRAQQMLRQVRRLQGQADPDGHTHELLPQQHLAVESSEGELGFGDELMDRPTPLDAPVAPAPRRRELALFERSPTAADPRLDAWCSFCCRPKGEVGPLVSGPAGAFICQRCARVSVALLGGGALPAGEAPAPTDPELEAVRPPPETALPAQARARSLYERGSPRVALVVGPAGAGKSAFLRAFGQPVAPPFSDPVGDRLLVDLSAPLDAADDAALLRWLEAHPHRRAMLAVRGQVPTPVMVLQGEHGETLLYDTQTLRDAVTGALSLELLSRVDVVLPLEEPTRADLGVLAKGLLESRGATLPAEATERLVELAVKSGRGAHELAALISRVPRGKHGAR